ncbi:MAG: transketolase [bacterium]
MKTSELNLLKKEAIQIRKDVLNMVYTFKDGHIGSALSAVEILLILYAKILNMSAKKLKDKERDRFILSKGHGCTSLYSVLARRGFFPLEELGSYCTSKSVLCGHPSHKKTPGVEVSTGSLGHGFPMGVGFALSAKLEQSPRKIFCLVGDGECNEGSIWEAAAIGAHFELDNLIAIIDYNKMQSSGKAIEVQRPQDLGQKWTAFGWKTIEINGHDLTEIYKSLARIPLKKGKPTAVLAHTIKAKGIPFMERNMKYDNKWHTGIPSAEEYQKALAELAVQEKRL